MPVRKPVDDAVEGRILTGFIVSSDFCRQVFPLLRDVRYFKVDYIREVVKWCKEYFGKFRGAPGKHIQDLFEERSARIRDQGLVDLIEKFLVRLSQRYEEGDQVNVEYLKEKALEYFAKRDMELVVEKVGPLLEEGKSLEARSLIEGYRGTELGAIDWVDPLNPSLVREIFLADSEGIDRLFRFQGALGYIAGYFERGKLIGFLGPVKRGKSFWLLEVCYLSIVAKCKTVLVSLEMNAKSVSKRLYKRLTATQEMGGEVVYPCFDCFKNQTGECDLPSRTSDVPLGLGSKGEKPSFSAGMRYRPCVACRGTELYSPATWFTVHKREKFSYKVVSKAVESFAIMCGRNLRVVCRPAFSANIRDIKQDLEALEYREGFVPDVIIVDYADILAPENEKVVGRDRYDETWKMLKNLAATRHCLVVTASQSTRRSIDKRSVTQVDVAEDIRKVAHVDMMLALSQTVEEKREGVMRVSVIASRDMDFDQFRQCLVLQQLDLGQPHLDSEIARSRVAVFDEDGLLDKGIGF